MTVVATKEEQLIIVMGEVERILTCPLEKLKVQLSKSFLNKDIKEELLKLMFFSDSKSSIVEKLKEIDKEYKSQLNYPNKVPFTTEEDFNSLSQTRLSTSKEFGQQFKEMNVITDDAQLNLSSVIDSFYKQKYASSEFKQFIKNYFKIQGITLKEFCLKFHIRLSTFERKVTGVMPLTIPSVNQLYKSIDKEFHNNLTQALKTCIELPRRNNFGILIQYLKKKEHLTQIEISKRLGVSQYYLSDLGRSREFISKSVTLKLKELILKIPDLAQDPLILYNEVVFCVLIRSLQTYLGMTFDEYASQLQITKEQLIRIEKTVTLAPLSVKKRYTEILKTTYGNDEFQRVDNLSIKELPVNAQPKE